MTVSRGGYIDCAKHGLHSEALSVGDRSFCLRCLSDAEFERADRNAYRMRRLFNTGSPHASEILKLADAAA